MQETENFENQILKRKISDMSDFESIFFRIVRFWDECFETLQIFELKNSQRIRFWMNFFATCEIFNQYPFYKISYWKKTTFSFILPRKDDKLCIFCPFQNARFWPKNVDHVLKEKFYSPSNFDLLFLPGQTLNQNFHNALDSETSFLQCVRYTEESFWFSKEKCYLNPPQNLLASFSRIIPRGLTA